MKKRIFLLSVILAMMAATCGCGQKDAGKEEATTQENTIQAETTAETVPAVEESMENSTSDNTEASVNEPAAEPESEAEPEPQLSGRVVIDIPDDFYEYLSPSGIYVTKEYPEDGSNIYIVESPLYGTLPDESEYTRKINENLTAQVGVKVSITMEEYEKTTVSGFEATKAVYSYSYDNMKFKRTEYTVNTNMTTTIAYTQVNNANWSDAFEESALSMRVE